MKWRLVALAVLGLVRISQAELLFNKGFEDGDLFSQQTADGGLCCAHSAVIVSSPARAGTKAVKFVLNSTDGPGQPGDRRAELARFETGNVGDIRWYAVSIWIDPSWSDTTSDPAGTVVMQWHTVADAGDRIAGPQLNLHVTRNEGGVNYWGIGIQSDSRALSINQESPYRLTRHRLGQIRKGAWADFVFYVKWSYNNDGVLKIWLNGRQVLDFIGPNTWNNQNPIYIKWGIYKAWWVQNRPNTPTTLIAYHDEIKVGLENSSYAEMAPSGTPAPPPGTDPSPVVDTRPRNFRLVPVTFSSP